MRVTNIVLGAVGVCAIAALNMVGCGSSTSSTSTSGPSTTTGSPGATTSSGSSGGGQCPPGAPSPAKCKAVDTTCVGLVSNKGQTKFGLRMSSITVTSPPKLASGLVSGVIQTAVAPNDPTCSLMGTATFNWLLQFDTTAGTLTTGGAKPVTDATQGYSFDMETLSGLPIAPITVMAKPDASGNFAVTMGQNLNVPIFLNSAGTTSVVLPLNQAAITMGTLSSNNDCIGSYNSNGLSPTTSCAPSATEPQFLPGGKLSGYITLKNADTVIIKQLTSSLCFYLSGATSGPMDSMGNQLCPKDAMGNISYMPTAADGGWCSTMNAPATATCADAVELSAAFSASSVKIN